MLYELTGMKNGEFFLLTSTRFFNRIAEVRKMAIADGFTNITLHKFSDLKGK